jgi:hypothetical protein
MNARGYPEDRHLGFNERLIVESQQNPKPKSDGEQEVGSKVEVQP